MLPFDRRSSLLTASDFAALLSCLTMAQGEISLIIT